MILTVIAETSIWLPSQRSTTRVSAKDRTATFASIGVDRLTPDGHFALSVYPRDTSSAQARSRFQIDVDCVERVMPTLARRSLHAALFCVVLALGGCMLAHKGWAAPSSPTGLQQNVTFTDYSPLSRSAELARRLLTPLSFQRVQQNLTALREQPVDLAQEKFVVYVPEGAPPEKGYGILVFVPPWPQARLPDGWSSVLDRHRLIFVSAANSGNEAHVIDRRVPLALLAYENIRRRYPLDPTRIYVGGMSGGSRVALRIALAYPDVFRGALLNAGSDPIGDQQVPLPPADLFRRFQDSTRLVYLTGDLDEFNMHKDLISQQSMRSWCVFDLVSQVMPRRGHEIADSVALSRALTALDKPSSVDPYKRAQCRKKGSGSFTSLKVRGALRAGRPNADTAPDSGFDRCLGRA